MNYNGSCHCGEISFTVEGTLTEVADCNCSVCVRMGSLHWFVPRNQLQVTGADKLVAYTFGSGTIKHYFCPKCGIHPFGEGTDPAGNQVAAINARCLEGVDLAALAVQHFDGKSL